MTDNVQPISRREIGKRDRRVRIVGAAYKLLAEVEFDDLSVKMIADTAGVCPATVFNLFGSKKAILEEVYARGSQDFAKLVARTSTSDSLDVIFDCISISADRYRAAPRFFRAVLRSPNDGRADTEIVDPMFLSRVEFWSNKIAAAIADGHLRKDSDPIVAATGLTHLASGALYHWMMNMITVDQFERDAIQGFAAHLMAFAEVDARGRLQARLGSVAVRPTPLKLGA